VAQAAATAATLLPGRFFLGVGSGEHLNEHVLGDRWPNAPTRQDMLREAISVIRKLWAGELVSFTGDFYEVSSARLYSVPDQLPPIYVAAAGEEAASLAAEAGDGLITTSPEPELVHTWKRAGGSGPVIGEMTLGYAADADAGARLVRDRWPMPAIPGELAQELPLPRHFEQAATLVTPDHLARIPVGPDPGPYLDSIAAYAEAGFTHLVLHQVGSDQAPFLEFAASELLPKARERVGRAA
jgi:coenzyme F420-dependent glucose-6-phosphate dehydrogenase